MNNKNDMNLNEVFFKEGFFAVTLGFLGLQIGDISVLLSSLANLGSVILAGIAIYTFIKKEKSEKKK